MKLEQVRAIAKEIRINLGQMKKAELIRAIQRVEGNDDCFGTGHSQSCGQTGCLWRDDCIRAQK